MNVKCPKCGYKPLVRMCEKCGMNVWDCECELPPRPPRYDYCVKCHYRSDDR